MCEEGKTKFKVGERVVREGTTIGALSDPSEYGEVLGVTHDVTYEVRFNGYTTDYDEEELVSLASLGVVAEDEEPGDADVENLRRAIKICRIVMMPNDLIAEILIDAEEKNPGLAPYIPAIREELGLPEGGVSEEDLEEAVGPEAVARADAWDAEALRRIFADVFGADVFEAEPVF